MPPVPTVTPNGERIRELRLEHGMSVRMLAARLPENRHVQTIHRIERGAIAKVSVDLLAQIARALKTTRADITLREPNEAAA